MTTTHEIVAELADLDPTVSDAEEGDYCFFCDAFWKPARSEFGGLTMKIDHGDNCLWVRATKVKADQDEALRNLLADWFEGELTRIDEFGCSRDYPALVEDAKARHATFAIPWDDNFVPEQVRCSIATDYDDD